ncbi:hypothetical protein A2U01_0031509 [Trifolium medium]|uniref:Uncharacterized protein n=1 Tax=Trifolium medium TaxID=97028 RepID=A0A392PGH9_9FABA|nr:hypothetical protein [Trifolium medium]
MQFHRPPTLMEAFAMARAYEARLDDNPNSKGGSRGPTSPLSPNNNSLINPTHINTNPHQSLPQSTSINPKSSTLPPLLPTPPSSLPVRHLPPAEIRDRRAKGLCFKCDEKWGPTHRCRSKVLLLVGADDDDIPPESEDLNSDDISGDISSLHALSSQFCGRSLRVSGMYNRHSFQILIDSGSTHNFIKPSLAERLGLVITPCPRFRVATGCGTFLVCQHCCLAAPLMLQVFG